MQFTKRLIPVVGAAALLATSTVGVAAQDDVAPIDLQARVDEFVGLVTGGAAAVTIRDGVMTTASAGIANAAGDPMEVDTPMLAGGVSAPLIYALALQLVDEGLLDLDAPVANYLPDAPVGEGATVRHLLESKAGIPRGIFDALLDASMEDPDRTWTTDEMVGLLDGSEAGTVGVFDSGYNGTLVTMQLAAAATGTDFATALEDRISGPLGLAATVHPEGDIEPPEGVAESWVTVGAGEQAYITDDQEAVRSSRPTVSSAADLASFMSAYLDGQVVSPDLMDETVLNEDLEILGYGLLRPEEMFGDLGLLDARYFGIPGGWVNGVNGAVAGAPATGDIVVVLANNDDLDAYALVRDIIQSWAPDPLIAGSLDEAAGTLRYARLFTCDIGQPYRFDPPPCEQDEQGVHASFAHPFELTGTFEGSAVMRGVLHDALDGTFTYSSHGVFMGDVEGCGSGTFYFTSDDVEAFWNGESNTYEHNLMTVVPGGTLPIAGALEFEGAEVDHGDGTASLDYTGTYTCDSGADAAGS